MIQRPLHRDDREDRGGEHHEARSAGRCGSAPVLARLSPAASRNTPSADAPTPSAIPRIPSAALMSSSRTRSVGRLLRVDLRRLVVAAVLDQDAVAVERHAGVRRGPAALADHGRAVLEQLGSIAVVDDRHGLLAVGELELDAVRRGRGSSRARPRRRCGSGSSRGSSRSFTASETVLKKTTFSESTTVSTMHRDDAPAAATMQRAASSGDDGAAARLWTGAVWSWSPLGAPAGATARRAGCASRPTRSTPR